MQSFCFFVATKEVGVRGLVPENNDNIKNKIDKIYLFRYKLNKKLVGVVTNKFFIYNKKVSRSSQ